MKTKARGKATKVRLFLFIIAVMTNWPALSSAEVPEVVPSNEYTHPQNMISVDGIRRLNMFCIGSGSPTVILDAGGGGSTMVWRHVQGQIATVTRVCAYDRAGLGFSDEQTRASDVLNAVDDLHRLLVAASIRLPIVYVGHSIAGLYGVMFNASFPHDIAGAVFVDPSFPHQNDVMIATFSTTQREAWYKSIRKMLDDQQGCLDLARKGQLAKLVTKQARDCADPSGYPESVDALLRAEVAREWASIPGNTAGLSEEESFSDYPGHPDVDDQEMEHIKADFGDKPLIVLTKAKAEKPEPGMSVAAQARVEAAWIAGHDALAKSSTRGRNIIVPNSKHFIQLDQPETVIKAIESVVADVRKLRLH